MLEALVVGGGVSGLCAGTYLADTFGRDRIRVLEAGDRPGGTALSDDVDGFLCEQGPNGFLDREPAMLEWVDRLGIRDRLVRANEAAARRYIYRNGRLHEIKPPPAFLRSPVLSLLGRARLLCEPFVRQQPDHRGESIWDFAARRIGREAADTLVAPMVTGIFGGDAKQLSLEHCFPRMAQMEREHGSLFRALQAARKKKPRASAMGPAGLLHTFHGGIETLPRTAAADLGEGFLPNTHATHLCRTDAGYAIETPAETFEARRVIIATPAYATAELVARLHAAPAVAFAAIPYASIAVVATAYPRAHVAHDLDGFGFLVPRTQGLRMLGCIWTSSLFPQQAPDGHVLLRTMIGGATDPGAVRLDDTALLDILRRELHPLLGIHTEPSHTHITRWDRGIPQYPLDHGDRLAAIDAFQEAHPGLALAGNAYRGVSLIDCVLQAKKAVARVVQESTRA